MPRPRFPYVQDSLELRGWMICTSLHAGISPYRDLLLRGPAMRRALGMASQPSPHQALAVVVSQIEHLGHSGDLSPQSVIAYSRLMAMYSDFLAGLGRETLDDADEMDVQAFLSAEHDEDDGGGAPALSTKYLRRSAVDLYYRIGRQLHVTTSDPARDIQLPPRGSAVVRPLDDAEILAGRAFAPSLGSRHVRAWALAEAGAATSEIPLVSWRDVDLSLGTVQSPGSRKYRPRVLRLTSWGLEQLSDDSPGGTTSNDRLVYAGRADGPSAQASASQAVSDVLKRAGIRAADVKPHSVRSWAARRAFDACGDVIAAARVLGVRSLDTAARTISHDWLTEVSP